MQVLDKHDYWVSAHFEGFEDIFSILRTKKQKMKKEFDWERVQKKASNKFTNLILAIKFRLNSANTSFVAFFSEEPYIQADVFKIIPNVSIERAKIICLYYNSTFNIVQIMSKKGETQGGFGIIRETDLLGFQLIDYEKLTDKEKEKLLGVFEAWSSVEFPSIVEQIEKRFEGRVAIDRAVLEVLGYKKGEINELLPELYDTVLRELKQDF
jgi:hypothetical protein